MTRKPKSLDEAEAIWEDRAGEPSDGAESGEHEGSRTKPRGRRRRRRRPAGERFVLTQERDRALRWAADHGMSHPTIRDSRLLRVSTAFLIADHGRIRAVVLVAADEVYGAVEGGPGALRFFRELPQLLDLTGDES